MTVPQRRAFLYVLLAAAVFIGAPFFARLPGWGAGDIHAVAEGVATTMALFLGILALVRFYSKKNNVFLFLGTGFLATAVLDGFHTVVTAWPGAMGGVPTPALEGWSWIAPRVMLGLFFCLNWMGWRRERARGQAGRVSERFVYAMAALLCAGTIGALQARAAAEVPPGSLAPPVFMALPAVLFAFALAGYLAKAHWRDNAFDHWLVISLILSLGVDTLTILSAERPYGGSLDAAHVLKLASYVCVGVGLFISVYSTFRQAEESTMALTREVEERERAQAAAEAATRAKSEFLAQMSHELRTPLNSVIGFANILRKNRAGRMGEQDLQYLDRIRDSGLHLLHLINEVLDLSKVEAGKMEVDLAPVDLHALVSEVVEQVRGQTGERSITLETRVPPDLEPIVSDPGKLKQILFNLVGNAVKFTREGSVTVAVRTGRGGRPVRIDVIDTGIGIPPDKRDAIFEAFQQADSGTARVYGGTGLGLTISRSLARLLGYRLGVESVEGKGSVFRVLLSPEVDPGTELAPVAPESSAAGGGSPSGVLKGRVTPSRRTR